jgi:hypothetical protein
MQTNSGSTDQAISSVVLCSALFSVGSLAARDLALYFVAKWNIATKMASAVSTLIQIMKSQTQSMLRVVIDASVGSQNESEGGDTGSFGSASRASR